jgi:hypothetical protein
MEKEYDPTYKYPNSMIEEYDAWQEEQMLNELEYETDE